MKRIVFTSALLFAMTSAAQSITPITTFQPATYLGNGSWIADDGSTGSYSSYTTVDSNGWTTIQNRNGQLYFYETVVSIDANGFFTAAVTDNSDPNNPVNYVGEGNCGSLQCQLIVQLSNGTLQKSMVVDPSTSNVYVFASIYYVDGTPNVQWEGLGLPLPANATDKEVRAMGEAAALINPITEFEPGNYLGTGAWLADDGSSGNFQTFVDMESDGWTSVKIVLGNLYIHETSVFFDENGFFSAFITDASDPSNPAYYFGNGNCGSSTCQLTVPLANGFLQTSTVFGEDSIYSFGAVFYNDGTANIQFEGNSTLLP